MFGFLRRRRDEWPRRYGPTPVAPYQCPECRGYGFSGRFVTRILPSEIGPISVQEWEAAEPFNECPECFHGTKYDALSFTEPA